MSGHPPPPLADAAERLRAVTTFDRNVIVTAGAGTGKTALLTDRFLNLLFRNDDPAKPSQCAALTFTHRAAGEMAERLRGCLERFLQWAEGGGPPPGEETVVSRMYRDIADRYGRTDGEMARIARTSLQELELAPISTYHSFAARLLRHFPVEAGVDPYFQEDDGTAFEEHFARRWDYWLSEELRTEARRAELWRRVLDRFGFPVLDELARELSSESIPLGALEEAVRSGSLFEPNRAWLEETIRTAKALIARFPGGKERVVERHARLALAVLEGVGDGMPEEALGRLAEEMAAGKRSKVQGLTREDFEACERLVGVASGLASLDRRALEEVLEAVIPFARDFRWAFVRAGFLSFDSLLVRARDLLRDHPEIRRRLKERYRHLLVDEFQDTDPVQYEIVAYLAEMPGREARDWRQVKLEAGRLFVVGDPKQSIYRFRGADIEAYHELLRDVLAEEPLQLRVNFRSHDRLVSAFNELFSRLIVPREKVQPHFPPAVPRPGEPATLDSQKVEIRVVRPPEGQPWNAAEATEGEAREIARWIREDLVGHAPVPDGEGGTRAVRYGDVALLFRKTTNFEAYLDALRLWGIPFVAESGRGFFEAQEVTDFLNLLSALVYPEDRLALAGVLRSPVGGLTDRELYEWSRGEPVEKAEALRANLEEVRRGIRHLPVEEAVDWILFAFPVLESAALLAGEQGRNNVLKLRTLAVQRESVLESGFAGLVDWLRGQGRDVRGEGESPLAEENVDAVKVLSVHKAKGLEFPVVILAGLHSGSRPRTREVAVQRDWVSRSWAVQAGSIRTPGSVKAEDRDRELEGLEERRLFYVAATRARERLIISAAERRDRQGRRAGADGFLAFLNEALGVEVRDPEAPWTAPWDGVVERSFHTPVEGWNGGAPSEEGADPPDGYEALWIERRRRADALRSTRMNLRPSHLNDEEGDCKAREPEGGTPPRSTALRIGSAVHRVMEKIDLKNPPFDADKILPAVLGELFPEVSEEERKRVAEAARRIVGRFLKSAAFLAGIHPFEVLGKEIPCLMRSEMEPPGAFEGYIDLVIRDGQGILPVDYKTDDVDEAQVGERASRYTNQGTVYARALQEALGETVNRFGLAFMNLRGEPRIHILEV